MIEEKLQYVELLKRKLCEVTRCEALSPSDFEKMVAYVNDKTKDTIGLSTLKRLYGYGGAKTRPRNSTLDIMANTVGYNCFSAFCDHYKSQATNLSSEDVLQPHISSDNLVVGQQLRICWNPRREIIVGYMGNNTYRVVRSQNSKLHVGDTFQCAFFTIGHSLLLSNAIIGNQSFALYEIGKLGGLTVVEQWNEKSI